MTYKTNFFKKYITGTLFTLVSLTEPVLVSQQYIVEPYDPLMNI